MVVLDTKLKNLEETVKNLKLHKDKVIYIGLGDKEYNIFDFHLKKPFTVGKLEALLNIIVKANDFKAEN